MYGLGELLIHYDSHRTTKQAAANDERRQHERRSATKIRGNVHDVDEPRVLVGMPDRLGDAMRSWWAYHKCRSENRELWLHDCFSSKSSRQTQTQTHRQTHRHTDRRTDTQTDRQTDRQTDKDTHTPHIDNYYIEAVLLDNRHTKYHRFLLVLNQDIVTKKTGVRTSNIHS
jgi:hypothetical protein